MSQSRATSRQNHVQIINDHSPENRLPKLETLQILYHNVQITLDYS